MSRKVYYDAIEAERMRQDGLHGGPRHDDTHTLAEWAGFVENYANGLRDHQTYEEARGNLTKIAALAVAAMESLDRLNDQHHVPLVGNCVYTFGYAGSDLRTLADHQWSLNAMIVDTRLVPYSKMADWTGDKLRTVFGCGYLHVGEFGNLDYKTGGMRLADFWKGFCRIRPILLQRPIILLCGCYDWSKCHRTVVAEHVARNHNGHYTHLGKRLEDPQTTVTVSP